MSYKHREIKVQVSLADNSKLGYPNTFDGQNNTLTIENCKCICSMETNGGLSGSMLDITIWGISLDHMSKIIGAGYTQGQVVNQHILRVWADGELFYTGNVFASQINMQGAPDISLTVRCTATMIMQQQVISDTYIETAQSFSSVVNNIAQKVGMKVNMHIDDFTIKPTYLTGSAFNQMNKLIENYRSKAVGVVYSFGVIDVYGYANDWGEASVIISPDNGLIGYPSFNISGIQFQCMYSHSLHFGSVVQLETNLPNASGVWRVTNVVHQISSWIDGGGWFTNIQGIKVNGSSTTQPIAP